MIDILLGGDNAIVIALACRNLHHSHRAKGISLGTVAAIALRVVLIFFALQLLAIPYLKLVGGALLVWIGIKLLRPDDEDDHAQINQSGKLWGAVKTVVIADLVMSIDNIIAIAGAAEIAGGDHKMPLVIFGLLVSLPIIVAGSRFVMKLMDKFPFVVTAGGMLLGWIAGAMVVTDHAVASYVGASEVLRYAVAAICAMTVLVIGKYPGGTDSRHSSPHEPWRRRHQAEIQNEELR